jgi:toxin ParE1/3/4
MKIFDLIIGINAEEELLDIFDYVSREDSEGKAVSLLETLMETINKLVFFSHRGHKIPEFDLLPAQNFLEIHYKPYRIIYKIVNDQVFVHHVLDGRRNVKQLLEEQLLKQ